MAEVTTLFVKWPRRLLDSPPGVSLPRGYALRAYEDGDEAAWLDLSAAAGYQDTHADWEKYGTRLVPKGLFFAIHMATSDPVGTGGAAHNTRDGMFPFGGEVGNVAVAPRHRGKGIGTALTAAAVGRLIAAGYTNIRAGVGPDPGMTDGTADSNITAIRAYLSAGFLPFIYRGAPLRRWRAIFKNWA